MEKFESTRFKGPSDLIDMDKLERETQKLLFLGLLVAVSFHAALGSYFIWKKTDVIVARPPTTELVIRRPRMIKPFEFKKRRIKAREYKKKEIVERKPTAEIKTKSLQASLIGDVATYDIDTKMGIDISVVASLPPAIDIEMAAVREPEKQISMKEEMISLDDLDTGQYKAMIIQDPQDKHNIKGFIYLSTLWGSLFEPAYQRAVLHLSDAVNRYTNITSKEDKHLYIDSRRIFDVPFVFLCADELVELTEIEAKNFGEYLRRGGFAVFDNGNPTAEFGAAEASLRQSYKDALGADAKFLPIPVSHPLYHCFYDFDDGPPNGSEIGTSTIITAVSSQGWEEHRTTMAKQVLYLEGIWLEDRLVAIYSDKGYAKKWAANSNNEPQLRMGVNMVVFALTQEGSIAQQKMDFFSAVQ